MFSRNLSVPDFVRRFFVSCAQISEAYAVRTVVKLGTTGGKSAIKAGAGKTPRGHYNVPVSLVNGPAAYHKSDPFLLPPGALLSE